ncbi:sodium/proline symporter [Anaerovorax odorimutans]|uniref:sodium/proline symporter n=1 Tax=Anaerovorax odorimutans TaxID=109327 RepID=UPI000418FA5C|nr:sodium/proline symporter [Anaerovorax odorimutans]
MRIEIIVLICYFIGMIGIGLYWQRRAKKSEDFLLGGRSMGPFITALTLQTTAMSGYMFMGGPSLAYAIGWFALFYAVGDAGGGIVNIAVMGRRMRRLSQLLDCISPIEYLEKRYNNAKPVKVIASVICIFGLSGYILAQFLAAGKTISILFNFPIAPSLIVGVGVILFYTFVGGYFAVAWTDVIQGIIMVSAVIGVLVLSISKIGGLTALNLKLAAIDPTYLSVWGKDLQYQGAWSVIAGAVLIYLIGYVGLPHVVIKHMAMESPSAAKTTLIYATVWNQLFIFSPYLLGLCGIILLPNIKDPELVIPELAFMMFPGVIAAVVLTAIMSAIMSTVAALLLLTGTVLSIDLYKRWLKPDATDKQIVVMSRIMIFAVGVVGIIIAIANPPGIFKLVIFAFGVMACSFMPCYFCAIWWKKANATGACAAMIFGGGTNFVMTAMGYGDSAFFSGAVAGIVAMYIGSQFGQKTTTEMIALIDKASGKYAKISPKIEKANCKTLVSEGRAVSNYILSTEYMKERGFSLSC